MDRPQNTNLTSTEVLSSVEAFIELREKWISLLERSPQNRIFLSWEWHYTWWQCFSQPKDSLQILLIKINDDIIGIAPLYLQHTVLTGKTLRFIGTGETEADEVVTEYLDFIALSGHEEAVIDAAYKQLENLQNWQKIEFNYGLENYLCSRVATQLAASFSLQKKLIGKAYSTPLESSETQYRETRLSSSRNKRLKRCLNALEKDGGGMLRKTIEKESEIEAHLATLRRLHDERWSAKSKHSIFASKQFMLFHRKLLTLLAPEGKANIALYSFNNTPIAAVYVMYSKNDCHYYQSGFSKKGENRYMPLFVSHIKEMNAAREHGNKAYDFMRGGSNSYKSDFGCIETDMFDSRIYRYSSEMKVINQLKKLFNFYRSFPSRYAAFRKGAKIKS